MILVLRKLGIDSPWYESGGPNVLESDEIKRCELMMSRRCTVVVKVRAVMCGYSYNCGRRAVSVYKWVAGYACREKTVRVNGRDRDCEQVCRLRRTVTIL